MAAHKRSKSDPPPITVEDTVAGVAPQLALSPTRPDAARAFSENDFRRMPPNPGVEMRERRRSTWGHKRAKSPNIQWKEEWTKDSWKQGRVLLIDYVAKEHTTEGRRKVVAQEFHEINGLRKFYMNSDLSKQAALRVIHVQNAPWATRFLMRKFNIDASDDLVGTSFGRWAKWDRPQIRGNKPVPAAKTFRTQRDPWRGISRTAFGLDYLRQYDRHSFSDEDPKKKMSMMELNHYDHLDQPAYGYDVFVQRLSVYVQRSESEPTLDVDPDIRNPYRPEEYEDYRRLKKKYGSVEANGSEGYFPILRTLDNGNTIIIIERSQSGSVEDTLIGARQELEARWRRLTFYLRQEEASTDDGLAIECMDFILRDIFKAVAYAWEKYVKICETHVAILEDKIYVNPADESRAPELWTNQANWLRVERLMFIHQNIVKEMRGHLKEITEDDPREGEQWLGNTSDEMEKLTMQFQEGVVKPTANLSDLMYKSVGIRDARHSLQLGLSMWRLSWITFIFLPLTFMVGFFGMNVDTFQDNPPLKWWFIVAIPLMLLVIILWYGVKHSLASQRQHPLRRGVYENLFQKFAKDHPNLWSRQGPRAGITPVGTISAVKWALLTRWFSPEQTLKEKGYDAGNEELGVWSRTKRFLAKRWLSQIAIMPQPRHSSSEINMQSTMNEDLSAMGELLSLATSVGIAEVQPTAASRLQQRLPLERFRSLSPPGSDGGRPSTDGRTSGDGASGVMVEEKVPSGDERSGDEGDSDARSRSRSSFQERLTVPLYPGGAGIVAGGL